MAPEYDQGPMPFRATKNVLLTDNEARVLGCLVEKEITTPDYYPLSLNALINACNQKSNRDPVMTLNEDAVRQAVQSLNEKGLAGTASSAGDSRVPSTNIACRKLSISRAARPPSCAC